MKEVTWGHAVNEPPRWSWWEWSGRLGCERTQGSVLDFWLIEPGDKDTKKGSRVHFPALTALSPPSAGEVLHINIKGYRENR